MIEDTTSIGELEQENANRSAITATAIRRFTREYGVGLSLALMSSFLGLLWLFAIKPFDAPDEPAQLQAVMQVRALHILPEVHYEFIGNTKGWIVNTPIDQPTYDYIVSSGIRIRNRLDPNESFQPPLYYVIVGLLLNVAPPEPQLMLYLSRLLSALFGAGAVFFCWAAVKQAAPTAPMW